MCNQTRQMGRSCRCIGLETVSEIIVPRSEGKSRRMVFFGIRAYVVEI